eukprot:NODE_135_length_16508_cov_1.365897.p8 type:complete len:267 gc:universal NODE_135_length_16508_cov_1.365897:5686-6486(+)
MLFLHNLHHIQFSFKRSPFKQMNVLQRKTYDKLRIYRKSHLAPVDTIGCEMLGEGTEKVRRFQTLIALMLSPQTRDEMTAQAMQRIKNHCEMHYERTLCLETLLKIRQEDFQELINCVGFYRTKAKNIKLTTNLINESKDKDIPDTIEGLTEFPGVGPKIGYLCLQTAYNKVDGIGVDVHVHRISNRLGWVDSKNPEDTRLQLQKFLPKEYWDKINIMLVGFGQTVCKSKRPLCKECPISVDCPSCNIEDLSKFVKTKKKKTTKSK